MGPRPPLARLRVVSALGSRAVPHWLAVDFPTIVVESADAPGPGDAVVDVRGWKSAAAFTPFDVVVEHATSDALALTCATPCEAVDAAREILTRYQRFIDRRNEASASPVFDRLRARHARAHDCSKPLVKADLDHALDTVHWMLRLEPRASLAAQAAALLHDVERLESEADRRIEHAAPDYVVFKAAHARRGAERAFAMLVAAGLDRATAARVRDIVAAHERRGGDLDVDLLNDADGLSFFSLNSPGYVDYFGPLQSKKKIAYTLARLGARARARLAGVRLRADVSRLLAEVVGS